MVLPVSAVKVEEELNGLLNDPDDTRISPFLKEMLRAMANELSGLKEKLTAFDRQISDFAKKNPVCQRLMSVPGGGYPDSHHPHRPRGRSLPLQERTALFRLHRSGTPPALERRKERAPGDLETGRHLSPDASIHGGRAVVRSVQNLASRGQELRGKNAWIADVVLRRGYNRAAVAVANKNARVIWVLLTKNDAVYDPSGRHAQKAA